MPRTAPDNYYVLMWNFMEPMFNRAAETADRAIARFREVGCNGATLISSAVDFEHYRQTYRRMGLGELEFTLDPNGDYRYRENDLPFYVMNLCPAIYMKWNKAKPIFLRQYQQFAQTRDRKAFTRFACPNDPQVRTAAIERIDVVMDRLAPLRDLSLLYDWRDELSITSFVLGSDVCFCEHCMARMRSWLQQRYPSLEALNAQWQTQFSSWDDVEPLTTLEAAERRQAGQWNFSPWADHRDFMNHSLAAFLTELKQRIAAHDPEALSGPTGTQCPSVFGGYDFSLLAPISDWVEAYDFGQSVDLFRSFKSRRDMRLLKTDFSGAPPKMLEAMLWTYVFQGGGHGGTIIWESNMMIDVNSPDLPPAERALARAPVYKELRSGLPLLLQRCEELDSPVAVHYSHASINADFIATVAPRPATFGAYEPERYNSFVSRGAWWKLLEDRGLRPRFVSSAQVEAGELLARGVKLLVLPRSIALSDAEAEQMRRFVQAGGVLAGDSFIGRMDAHCRERDRGALDDLFGLRRTGIDNYHHSNQRASLNWDAAPGEQPVWGKGCRAECSLVDESIEPTGASIVMGCTEYSDTPLGLRSAHGQGQAVLFNATPADYLAARRGASAGAGFQEFFGKIVDLAGVAPLAEVFDADSGKRLAGWRVWAFANGQARYFAVAADLAVSQDVLGAISGEADPRSRRRVRIKLSASGHVYESRSGRYLGCGDSVEDTLDATAARLYAVLPTKAEAVELTRNGDAFAATLRADGPVGECVFRFDLLDEAGRPIMDLGANVVAAAGQADWQPASLAGSAVRCRDVATGVSATLPLK